MGAALPSNVVNRDNGLLESIGAIGYVSEVNGKDAAEVAGFVPTRHELLELVKHWASEIIDYDFKFFCFQPLYVHSALQFVCDLS